MRYKLNEIYNAFKNYEIRLSKRGLIIYTILAAAFGGYVYKNFFPKPSAPPQIEKPLKSLEELTAEENELRPILTEMFFLKYGKSIWQVGTSKSSSGVTKDNYQTALDAYVEASVPLYVNDKDRAIVEKMAEEGEKDRSDAKLLLKSKEHRRRVDKLIDEFK